MKKFVILCSIALALLCLAACSSEPSNTQTTSSKPQATAQEQAKPQEPQGLSIAAFLQGAGPDEAATKAFERGMELAAEKTTPAVLTRKILDRAQGAPESPSFQPLLSSVPLVVYWQTSDLAPAVPTLKQSEVIAVPVWNVTKKVATFGNKVFGFGYSTERSFADFAKFAGNKLKSYRFAVLSSSAEPLATQSKAFIEETKSQGNTIVFEEKVDSASADFKALITRAVKEKCDTIFAVLPGDALVAFIKAARGNSFKGKLLVGDTFFTAEREALGKDADGVYLLQAWSDDATFKAQYAAQYGAEPDGITLGVAALGYDLIQCIGSVGSNPDAEAISYSWLSTPCNGLTGTTMFSGERIAQRTKRILIVKGEKFELAG